MSAKPIESGKIAAFLREFGGTDPEELRHGAHVSLWVRWFVMAFCLLEVNYRVEYGALSHILNNFYVIGFMAVNGYVQYLVRRNGEAKPAWLLGLSVMDLAGISFSVSLSGGFNSPYFPLYYFAVTMFAWLFTSPPPGPVLDHSGGHRLLGAERVGGAGAGPGRQRGEELGLQGGCPVRRIRRGQLHHWL